MPSSADAPAIPKDQLPEVLAGTLDHIVGQLDMMTRTLAILDRRLSLQEDMMAKHVFNADANASGVDGDAIYNHQPLSTD
jgi:hypothetical protein